MSKPKYASHRILAAIAVASSAVLAPTAVSAQDEPRRVRVGLGPNVTPSYPGADSHKIGPYVDVDTARGDAPFAYEAPDESFSLPLINLGDIYIGPTLSLTGSRDAGDAPGLREIDTTVEVGASISATITPNVYAFVEGARGIGGHDGWKGQAGVDYVMRSGDDWLFSIGPRASFGFGKYMDAYYGISAPESPAASLPPFDPDGGLESVGGTASTVLSLGGPWGVSGYVRYERLVGDASDSPVTRAFGSRDQISGGVGLNYTFNWNGF